MSWWQERHWQVIKQGVLDWDGGRVPRALRSWFRGYRESLFWEDMYLSLSYGKNNLNLGGMRKELKTRASSSYMVQFLPQCTKGLSLQLQIRV